jgi:hypothetical protein
MANDAFETIKNVQIINPNKRTATIDINTAIPAINRFMPPSREALIYSIENKSVLL